MIKIIPRRVRGREAAFDCVVVCGLVLAVFPPGGSVIQQHADLTVGFERAGRLGAAQHFDFAGLIEDTLEGYLDNIRFWA